jgi:hypothetical protein
MTRDDRKKTKVYTRCEACGKVARTHDDRDGLPDGWIDLGRSPGFNAARAVCSAECQRKVEAR